MKTKKKIIIATIYMAIISILFGSCRTVRYVTVPEYHTDTAYITNHQRDSIWLHDSVYVHEWLSGDTIYIERYNTKTKYVERVKIDTIYRSRVDSVVVPYPVEAKLTHWQQFRLHIANITMFLLAILAIIFFIFKKTSS